MALNNYVLKLTNSRFTANKADSTACKLASHCTWRWYKGVKAIRAVPLMVAPVTGHVQCVQRVQRVRIMMTIASRCDASKGSK